MSNTQYLSCAETAKLVRAALKESFPGVKFSVKSSTYAGGASIMLPTLTAPTLDKSRLLSACLKVLTLTA
jgi:hypothetical protein